MRYFKTVENKDNEFKIFELMGRAGEFDIGSEPAYDVDGVIDIVSQYCDGPKEITIVFTVD